MPGRWSVTLILQPVGSVSVDLVEETASILAGEVLPVEASIYVSVWRIPPPLNAYDFGRRQYRADLVAGALAEYYSGVLEPFRRLVVGIVDADAYVEGLNFVFGLALPSRGVAVVFTRRLAYRATHSLFVERLVKEVAHEVGHLLGLGHCPRRECVMSFSNSLEEVDLKRAWFCPDCRAKLARVYKLRTGLGEPG